MRTPAGLGPDGKRALRRAIATMEATGTDADLFEEPLTRLAELHDDLALARRRWVAKRRPMSEKGSTGQQIPSVYLRVMSDLRKEISGLETELALTVLSQRKAGRAVRGRPPGAASAADRRQPPTRRRAEVVKLMPPSVREALGDR
jgi:hypothetical protein